MKDVKYIGDADDFVNADRVMKQGILLACHHGLNNEMLEHLYTSIDSFISQYTT
jgi:CDP-6-deoxy-D-xylo-4-hexulose-3-dehydrase